MATFPFQVGQLYNGGIQNGIQVYTQPGGIGTPVFPQPPQTSPPKNWRNVFYLPVYPTVFTALLSLGCGHWVNAPEIYTLFDPSTDQKAALCCCPVCSYIQEIIEPEIDWYQIFYSLYPVGIRQPGGGLIPSDGG